MIARSFTSVAWVAAIGAAALICYIFSLRVAEERAELASLEAQIHRAEQSIQTLKTELGTRGRVHQLQHWAASDFGFASPTANQFMADEVTLASLQMPVEPPALETPVRMASASPSAADLPKPVQAAAPAPAPERVAVRQASAAPRPAPLRQAAAERRPAERGLLRRAAAVSNEPAAARTQAAARSTKPAATPTRRPARSAALIDPRTLRAIEARAQTEREAAR